MKAAWLTLIAMLCGALGRSAAETPYTAEIQQWRAEREKKLRADNGWLTLAGRYPLDDGPNSFGTSADNDAVFPTPLEGTGPARLGTLEVDSAAKTVTLRLADGVEMTHEGAPFRGERQMSTSPERRDWVSLGRLSFHVIERNGKYFLRLADNESPLRREFPGCQWYPPDERYRVTARFVPYAPERTLPIVNIVDEVSEQPCAGYAEFELDGQTHRLDAIREGEGLFFVFRDATAGDTTYRAGRFIDVARLPEPQGTFVLDFNQAYNPPCAWSSFTTCPLPPPQNILPTRIEAGERFSTKP
jgi:uncharacterized protein (DUF1684 family)